MGIACVLVVYTYSSRYLFLIWAFEICMGLVFPLPYLKDLFNGINVEFVGIISNLIDIVQLSMSVFHFLKRFPRLIHGIHN